MMSGANLKKLDVKSILNKTYPDCAQEALKIIKLNNQRFNRQELNNLANEFIFFNEFKHDQWVKKTNCMQELQCVDCITNFLENETDASVRDFVFDLLFNQAATGQSSSSSTSHSVNLSSSQRVLQLLISYAISLEAKHTLECLAKWIVLNIGNEFIQFLFNQLIKDHLLLVYSSQQNADSFQGCFLNLVDQSPMFASLFLTITCDMLANDSILSDNSKIVHKLLKLYQEWLDKNPLLPLYVYRLNQTHPSSYMFNPLPAFLHLICIYPLKSSLVDKYGSDEQLLIAEIHLHMLKLVQYLAVSAEDPSSEWAFLKSSKQTSSLISLNNLELIFKQMVTLKSANQSGIVDIERESINRLAQLLIVCVGSGFMVNFNARQFRDVYGKHFSQSSLGSQDLFLNILFSS